MAMARVHFVRWQAAFQIYVQQSLLPPQSYADREELWQQFFREQVKTKSFALLTVTTDEKIVGFASAGPEETGDSVYQGEVYRIYLLPTQQGRGIGRCLMAMVADRLAQDNMRTMLVWAWAQNPARRFYESLGGQEVATRQEWRRGILVTKTAYGWLDTTLLSRW